MHEINMISTVDVTGLPKCTIVDSKGMKVWFGNRYLWWHHNEVLKMMEKGVIRNQSEVK